MRASGRGGRQGPRGDRLPPRALLRPGASLRARKRLSLSRLRRWYLRTAPLCASCRECCKAPPACWGMRQTGASNLLSFITWLFSTIFF